MDKTITYTVTRTYKSKNCVFINDKEYLNQVKGLKNGGAYINAPSYLIGKKVKVTILEDVEYEELKSKTTNKDTEQSSK